MSLLKTAIKSTFITEEISGSAATVYSALPQISSATVATTASELFTIECADLVATAATAYVGLVFEALDGNCKGEQVLCVAFDGTTTATVTGFRTSSVTSTQFRLLSLPTPWAVATGNGSTTSLVAAGRNEANDYWNGHDMYLIGGTNEAVRGITDFTASTGTFVLDTAVTSTVTGDLGLPGQCIRPIRDSFTMEIDGGVPLARNIMTDSPDEYGVIIGSKNAPSCNFELEVRGLNSAAGDVTPATAPDEAKVCLRTAFTESLGTGSTITRVGGVTDIDIDDVNYAVNQAGLVNGDAFFVSAVATSGTDQTLTIPTGHVSVAPAVGDIVYAAANYKAKDSGHRTCSIVHVMDQRVLGMIVGALPKVSLKIENGQVLKWGFNYMGQFGFFTQFTKDFNDVYDTATPIVSNSQLGRMVINGSAATVDIISMNLNLSQESSARNVAFSGAESKGGKFYTGTRQANGSMIISVEEMQYHHWYRANSTFDVMVQVGTIPTAAFAFYAPRCQWASVPSAPSDTDGRLTFEVKFNILRPTTTSLAPFYLAVF